jgi:hypothetical protein
MYEASRKVHACDVCQEQRECQDLFVAMRILEAEMIYCEDKTMHDRFFELKTALDAFGFAFPYGPVYCQLSINLNDAQALQIEAQKLREGLRRKLRLYS